MAKNERATEMQTTALIDQLCHVNNVPKNTRQAHFTSLRVETACFFFIFAWGTYLQLVPSLQMRRGRKAPAERLQQRFSRVVWRWNSCDVQGVPGCGLAVDLLH